MPPLTAAQRGGGPWHDPGRWVCLEDGCPRYWREGGQAAWRYHAAQAHPGPHRHPDVQVIAVFEAGRLDGSERAITHDLVRQLLDRRTPA